MNSPQKTNNGQHFELDLESMCRFAAISNTRNYSEALHELLLQTLVVIDDDKIKTPKDVCDAIYTIYGLRFNERQIEESIEWLSDNSFLVKSSDTSGLFVPPLVKKPIQRRISAATELEERVKNEWLDHVAINYPLLDTNLLWSALQEYLTKSFRRHGFQTVALLDPSIEGDTDQLDSLSYILKETVNRRFDSDDSSLAIDAISHFLADVGEYPDRTTYITQLGDGAFAYFSLTVDPEVANKLREQLSQLVLFLDTNFLFGLLDVHVNPQVDTARELMELIPKYKFPFLMRYHEITKREMESTISYFGGRLKSYRTSKALSRAVIQSRSLSGIELRFHQLHAETGIDVESFMRKLDHADILLEDMGIKVNRSGQNRIAERSELLNEYQEFLSRRSMEKSYDTINHDVTLIDTVRQLRSKTKNSLHSGGLILTCDYTLYRFDWGNSKKNGHLPCTVLPNLFWQALRPFVPTDSDFDRAFAETFAIPEFRTISSNATKATSRLLSLLTNYKGLPIGTVKRLLSNDLLIESLRGVNDNEQFQAQVELAIVQENKSLMEEKASLERQIDRERRLRLAREKELLEERDRENKETVKQLSDKGEEIIAALTQSFDADRKKYERTSEENIAKETQAREEAERIAKSETDAREALENRFNTYKNVGALFVSLLVASGIMVLLNIIPWKWLIDHPNSYGLQSMMFILMILGIVYCLRPKWRDSCWKIGILPFIIALLQIIGGPTVGGP